MQITDLLTDDGILEELGERLARSRIDRQLTQAQLAEQAGIGKRTVERMEAGSSAQLASLIRVLRVLGLLTQLDQLLPPAGPRPLDYLEREGKPRQRASSRGSSGRTEDKPWSWDKDA